MILHIVLFDFVDGITWNDEHAIRAESITQEHAKNIPNIKGWFVGRNIITREQAADFCVIGLFENENELSCYQMHHDHLNGVKNWREISSWRVIDLHLDSMNFNPLLIF